MVTLVVGLNSNVTYEQAVEYFTTRIDVAAWDEAPEDDQKKAVATATAMLDQLDWEGRALDASQRGAFPRKLCFFDPRLGFRVEVEGVPDRVEQATCELAYHLLNNDGVLDETGGVQSLSLGPIELSGVTSAAPIPENVRRLVKPLLLSRKRPPVWRAW